MLHAIFQRTGRFPHEVWALSPGQRAFVFASMETELEALRRKQAQEQARKA